MAESIGERIKALRSQQGMTLAELGDRTGLSTSYLSQIERDKTTPSLITLTNVARALNVGLRHFFEIDGEVAYVVRAERGPHRDAPPGSGRPLSPEGEHSKLVVQRVVIAPRAASGQLPGLGGEELLFVLAGELRVVVGAEEFCLEAGDSVHYDATQPHRWVNESDSPCTAIWSRAAAQI